MPKAVDGRRTTPHPVLNYLAQIAIVCGAYFVSGRLGLATPFTSGNVSPVWPASGIALAAVLLWGYRVWPGIAAGAFLVNFLSLIPHAGALGLAVGNTLAALIGAFLLRQIAGFQPSLSRLRDVLGLIVLAAMVSTTVSASIGVAVLFAAHVRPWSDVGAAWLMYWLGDGMGVLLVTPLVLAFPTLSKLRSRRRIAELTALVLLLAAVCFFIYSDRTLFALKLNVLAFAVFPFVIWAAIRFGVGGCALSTVVIAGIATGATARGFGPFAQATPFMSAALLQVYFAVLSVSGLALAALIAEREKLVSEQASKETRLQAEKALRNSEKLAATGRLAATIAHEINNPLEALTNLLYLLESDTSLSETGRRYVQAAEQEIKRTAHITKQMLAFHRQSATPVEVSLAELLDGVLELYGAKIQQGGITVRKQYECGTTIEGFPAELRQMFANLVRNAIEAVGPHGVIRLHVFASHEWSNSGRSGVRVVVADNGVGISPENRRRLFEPFVTTKGERGTGLGLWVSSGIVQKHQGSIRVHSSTRSGRSGTSFSIFLPDASTPALSKAALGA